MCVVKSEIGYEKGHGKTHTGEQGKSQYVFPARIARKAGYFKPGKDPCKQKYAYTFAHNQACNNAQAHRVEQVLKEAAPDNYTGVGQGKERYDDKTHPRMQDGFQFLQRGLGRVAYIFDFFYDVVLFNSGQRTF